MRFPGGSAFLFPINLPETIVDLGSAQTSNTEEQPGCRLCQVHVN